MFAETPILNAGQDLSFAPASLISQAIDQVVAVEAPLHIIDMAARVAARWDCLVSAKRMNRIRTVAEMSAGQGRLILRGDFVYDVNSSGSVPVRQRAGTKVLPERIAPEEYREAILMILREGDGLERKLLTNHVRALFGFSRTGPNLEAAIGAAIDALLVDEVVGEGSTGIRLRE